MGGNFTCLKSRNMDHPLKYSVDQKKKRGKSEVEFSIAIHFHYAVMPDTYTIRTEVRPHP